jgi:hypothetical protein
MTNSISPNNAKGLAVDLESLRALKPDELAERWRSLFGSDPPARLRRPLLIQALAYRLQEKAFGGMHAATRRLLESVAAGAGSGLSVAVQPRRSVKAGAVLIREWHGTKHQVTALKDGFMFSGKHFQSLSKIACEITGTRWSVPLFFGVKNSRREQQDGTR